MRALWLPLSNLTAYQRLWLAPRGCTTWSASLYFALCTTMALACLQTLFDNIANYMCLVRGGRSRYDADLGRGTVHCQQRVRARCKSSSISDAALFTSAALLFMVKRFMMA